MCLEGKEQNGQNHEMKTGTISLTSLYPVMNTDILKHSNLYNIIINVWYMVHYNK